MASFLIIDPIVKNSRLKELRSLFNLSQEQMAVKIGVTQGNYSGMERGSRPIGKRLSNEIITTFGIKSDWWETGEGPMFDIVSPQRSTPNVLSRGVIWPKIEPNAEPLSMVNENDVSYTWTGSQLRELEDGTFFMSIPLIEDYAYAGYLAGWNDREYVEELPKHTFNVAKRHTGKYRAFRVRGDSMDDGTKEAICSGDIAVGRSIAKDLWMNKLHLHRFKDYVIVHQDGIVIKRIIQHDTETGIITCESLNPDKKAYPTYDINLAEVYELFNIVSVERKRGW